MATTSNTLECSTFQNRPAYHYLRQSDKLPTKPDDICRVKLFDPTGSWTWYISSYDPETRMAWGLVEVMKREYYHVYMPELLEGLRHEYGDISMPELVEFRGRFGLPIERDLHWSPCPLSELER